jgi:predicted SnoaL-like aldol condensation-catalyzing enzyme
MSVTMKSFFLGILSFFTLSSFSAEPILNNNKAVVLSFYQFAINEKNVEAALPYLGEQYIQHNPNAQDGIEGLKKYIAYLKATYPHAHSDIKRILAEGDYVILHVHSIKEPNTRGEAIMDIFRLEQGKIVEHWDVHQPVPEHSANDNGMF